MPDRTWEDNAREYSELSQGDGWAFAVLVACSVEKDNGHGTPRDLANVTTATFTRSSKVSATRFAEAAATSAGRVLRFLEAWERAVEAGLVPAAADLSPSDARGITLPDRSIKDFYTAANTHIDHNPERRAALEAQAKTDGVGAGKVLEIAANPKAMAAAIKADTKAAEAARNALRERADEDYRQRWMHPEIAPGTKKLTEEDYQELRNASEELEAGRDALVAGDNALDAAFVKITYIMHHEVTLSGNPRAREILEAIIVSAQDEIDLLDGEAGVAAGAAAFLRGEAQ